MAIEGRDVVGMKGWKFVAVGLFLIVSVLPLGAMSAPSDEGTVAARDTGRVVLGELFTATWCGYCPAADNSFSALIDDSAFFPDRLAVIEWHPTNNDVYGFAAADARVSYYGVTGFPTAVFDGVDQAVGGSSNPNDPAVTNWYKGKINARPATSKLSVDLNSTMAGSTGNFWLNVTALSAITNTSMKVKVVVIEDLNTTHNNGALRWTARNLAMDSALTIANGETKPFSGSFVIDGSWTKEKLGLVTIVQSDATKEVLQSSFFSYAGMNKKPTVASTISDFSFNEDTTDASINLKSVFTDPEGDALTFSNSGNTKIGVAIAANGVVTLTPVKDWNGKEKITFTAKDSMHSSGTSVSVNVTVSPVNDPPFVKKSIFDFSMTQGTTKTGVDLDDIFGDIDSNLTFTAAGNDKVTVAINPTTHVVSYTAPDLYTGKETMTFTGSDGQYQVTGTVNVTVLATNHAPTAVGIKDISIAEDGQDTTLDLRSVFTDLDGFDTMAFEYSDPEGHMGVSISAQKKVTLTPVANWNGMEVVSFTANDGIATPVIVPANITVMPVNDAPEVFGALETLIMDEDSDASTTAKSLKSVFRDIDGDALGYSVTFPDTKVSVEINSDGTVTIDPVNNFNGKVELVFSAKDPSNAEAVYMCNLTVSPINDAPVITNSVPSTTREFTMNEGDTQVFNLTALDVDGDVLSYTWTINLKVKDETSSSYTYAPDFKAAGTHKLTVVVSDGKERAETTWNVKVIDVNRKPVIGIGSPLEGAVFKSNEAINFQVNASDLDNDKLTFKWSDNGAVIGEMATFTKTLSAGAHKIRVEVSDGKVTESLEVSITVKKTTTPGKTTPGFEGILLIAGIFAAVALTGRKLK